MLASGRRESERVGVLIDRRFLRGCDSFWTRGAADEKREEKVSKLWSDMGREELEKLDREQRRVKTRSRVCPSL